MRETKASFPVGAQPGKREKTVHVSSGLGNQVTSDDSVYSGLSRRSGDARSCPHNVADAGKTWDCGTAMIVGGEFEKFGLNDPSEHLVVAQRIYLLAS
ncbi:hypothetical protein [Micromonospora sp. NBC_01813]|uniref:hypothetical protein n=1 Tax=Micromonospora sp. NBC_01813 TaxID=2975988 RepID=UPI002DD88190|nr:hypothetical protein [Micromonospora sp. NBC_01813]WSA07492.1 hypothetical protein OG958_25070 [Micromonospora sp. NBC_01813]